MSSLFPAAFSEAAEALLSGAFICKHTRSDGFELLSQEGERGAMDRLLRQLGRRLRSTQDGSAYYAALENFESIERKASLRLQFAETINYLEPVCRWLSLQMSASQRDASLEPGDVVRQGELLTAIERTPALGDELFRMTRAGLFKTTREGTSEQLNAVFNGLEKEGYLVSGGGKSKTFVATGKWSYLYEVLEFIHTHEEVGLDLDAGAEEQGAQQDLL